MSNNMRDYPNLARTLDPNRPAFISANGWLEEAVKAMMKKESYSYDDEEVVSIQKVFPPRRR